jgi:dihydrodiol dehydrogenase / D-xylose 1-dehydrogenase (NADP)
LGILATGKVAHDFVQTLKFLRNTNNLHDIVAVGSRTIERAKEFGTKHNIHNAYGSYEELCNDSNVDIIYVASLHPDHFIHARMALENGKHVLIEKPITMNVNDAETLYKLGKELNLFVGEGMWTRFFPVVEWARIHIDTNSSSTATTDSSTSTDDQTSVAVNNTIGTVRMINADFSIDGDDVGPYPSDSIYALDLGGGAIWTMAPYVIGAHILPFGKEPDTIAACGIMPDNDDDNAGVLAVGMTLTFKNSTTTTTATESNNLGGSGRSNSRKSNSPPSSRSIASGIVGYLAESSEETLYAGKKGRIKILGPAHCPTSAILTYKSDGRGNGDTTTTTTTTTDNNNMKAVEFPLPSPTEEIIESGGIQMPNSMGFIYEAETVRRLIAANYFTFPQWTPEENIGCIRTMEYILKQIH